MARIYKIKVMIQNNQNKFKFLNSFDDASIFFKKSLFYLNIALTLNANNFLSDRFVKKMKDRKKKAKFICNS